MIIDVYLSSNFKNYDGIHCRVPRLFDHGFFVPADYRAWPAIQANVFRRLAFLVEEGHIKSDEVYSVKLELKWE